MEFELIKVSMQSDLSWVAEIVKWLIGITSSIAIGVILFTLVLKLITFPFDFYSRYSMRKNSVIMEEMRPELEKLQKQYADDKVLYNQKMMAIYKKNGYSAWGACLPTILTLVIFIVAINGFSSYSNYQNREYLYDMAKEYNSVCYDGFIYDEDYFIKNSDGSYTIKNNKKTELLSETKTTTNLDITKENDNKYTIKSLKEVDSKKSFIYLEVSRSTANSEWFIKYFIDDANDYENLNNFFNLTGDKLITTEQGAKSFLEDKASVLSANKYKNQKASFLWVKNIWITDSPISHPVYEKWKNDSQSCFSCFGQGQGFSTFIDKEKEFFVNISNDSNKAEEYYQKLTKYLSEEKSTPNGYFILCVLTAGITFLMQFVMSKSQKAQMELQTVDGQGARQQKMMMWMMPILMAVFSFMYTAAFSIYLILSSIISILTTFLINWIVDKKLVKAKAGNGKNEIVRNKSFVRKVVNKDEKKKEEKEIKDKKKDKEEEKGDFLK